MTIAPVQQNPFLMSPENYVAGGGSFVPGANIPGNGKQIVDGSPTARPTEIAEDNNFFGEDGMGFSDVLDVINPLQHIPIVGDLYRAITADAISPGARMAGGALYGGPLGFVSSLVNTVVEEATGKDIGGNILAAISGISGESEAAAGNAGVKLASVVVPKEIASPGKTTTSIANVPDLPSTLVEQKVAQPTTAVAGPFQISPQEQKLPQLSSAAFQAIMGSVNSKPQVAGTPGGIISQGTNNPDTISQGIFNRGGLTAGSELPAVKGVSIRDAGMEINRLLRNHAEQKN